ncbi:MAG: ATP-binding cassette domain-containing protein [candidate division KSB1 bacterium]|nr:ATP-binding cassette domain-containing protein [candidate division KSB1 bacterium]MDZ7379230.1 ATP-binding cassette domain-containing protein [candidate division KSB1 bacterium]MDZ7385935.1 ATP-binding cassette domain-containing protein [candidate division KSB1 bacterium]MDZ7393546.1 ATP-binding cassette domain-containing protein [candidate division KSB1 bacterium]
MIQVIGVSFSYPSADGGTTPAIDGVSLTIEEGESLGLMGANSSGKTTLARCLNALLVPTRGQVLVDGLDTRDQANHLAIRQKVGMVFQNPDNQLVSTTVEREIAFGLENLGVPHEEMHARVDQALAEFDLERYRNHPPHLLSGGEKQRLALAAVMAMRPKYLILDEPTSLLDPKGREAIVAMIQRLHREEKPDAKVSTLLISQYPEELLGVDRLLVMHKGRLVMEGPPGQVFRQVERLHELGLEPPVEYELEHLFARHGLEWHA